MDRQRDRRRVWAQQPWKSEARFRLMGDLALCSCDGGTGEDREDKSIKVWDVGQWTEGTERMEEGI